MKSGISSHVRRINRILRHNRQVMSQLVPEAKGKIAVSQTALINEGFNFTYHTHTYTTKNGHTYFFCYEYGYMSLEKEMYVLVKWKESK